MSDRVTNPLPRRLLGVWAHPDDESYLSAGLMGRVIDAGGQVTVLTATDGEHGFADDDPRPPAARAALRRAELRDAMSAVGVTDVRHLGLPDGGLTVVAGNSLINSVSCLIRELEPDTIVTFGPDGVTGHPDHICISSAATRAWREAERGQLLYACHPASWWDEFAPVHERIGLTGDGPGTVTPDDEVVLTVDLDPAELDRKRSVMAGHHSQTAALAGQMGEETYRRWITTEWFRAPEPATVG